MLIFGEKGRFVVKSLSENQEFNPSANTERRGRLDLVIDPINATKVNLENQGTALGRAPKLCD